MILHDTYAWRSTTSESGAGASYDKHKRRTGRKVHLGVNTPTNEQERAHVTELAALAQDLTGQTVELALGRSRLHGRRTAAAAAAQGIQLQVVKLPEVESPVRGFVLLPRRRVVERSFAWLAGFRRLGRHHERLRQTVAGLTFLAFTCSMLRQLAHLP